MNNFGTFKKLCPLSLLRHLSSCGDTTCLQVSSNSVSWLIYLDQGKIIYATHSVEPFDRLERHLRRLSYQIPTLTSEARVQLRLMFEPDSQNQSTEHYNSFASDYQAICWLATRRYLQVTQIALLIQELVKEVIESFLLIKQGTYEFRESIQKMPKICKLDVEKIVEKCEERLAAWQSFNPQISSPFQRPYLWIQNGNKSNSLPDIQQNLAYWMKGFSLRHLAVILNQDEIQLARSLYPHIINKKVLLHEPDPPFDKLPKIFEPSSLQTREITTSPTKELTDTVIAQNLVTEQQLPQTSVPQQETPQQIIQQNNTRPQPQKPIPKAGSHQKVYKIVSVDDSPTVLKEISRFLEDENFSVITISDPLKAVMSIIKNKPDLILLDLNMEGIDGYELARIIRNNAMFKNTPIIMVTGSKGIIDKVRARLVGASGYLTKPFTRTDLLKIVFMHVT
ncbi:response regulator [Aetokthonos hydrillicola Thurmond2011]|jgi:twitching motility two-component system response regulator PilG|uniref:Protein PatA n=1 Tax=Aetokthonos hydrillicola Thurmond2011 TaxID=2712845 RepID=A0AAP5IDB6_9CYAN|nr:response regulator [Aetokthonos hydrillicola]MBO3463144.1 response regulator [Aetokthonos hydrillicola CCALA 1050]MBW4589662.1 response regulator [Aetokthonos hydrillicola CCALA 1050]MDR9899159.1 response regulator [Aetokthonos hydrillicola Thurmond2011]